MRRTRMSVAILAVLLSAATGAGIAHAQVAQTPLAGSAIPQFVEPLPDLKVVLGNQPLTINMCEFKTNVLPAGAVAGYTGTYTWGYFDNVNYPSGCPTTNQNTYLGPVIVATRNTPTEITFVNNLGDTTTTKVLAWTNSTDQTLHWADPLNMEMNMCNHSIVAMMLPMFPCDQNYIGPIPAVPHLHGGEVPPVLDGGPDAWFTSDGAYKGHGYYTGPGAPANGATYRYPNVQEAAPLWFHDHTLGATRLNVYAGLAGGYLLTDPPNDPANLPPLVPLVIQDRMFDVNGQLFFPSDSLGGFLWISNPEHPFWVPEFVGDTIAVNGKVWPFKDLAPKRYRFLFINGSNARTYELFLVNPVTKAMGPPMYVIGTDGGYLDAPVKLDPNRGQKLLIMPGERYDVIVDFGGLPAGTSLILRNTAKTPYPGGAIPSGITLGRVIQFRVNQPFAGPDTSYDPAGGGALRTPMVRLVNPAAGTLAVTAQKTRQLTLNEVMGMPVTVNGVAYPGGPLEILVNNTRWDGKRPDGTVPNGFTPVTINGITDYYSEIPNEGDTEVWEVVNLTADAHPIHLHLVQFQILSRQSFNTNKYNAAYAAAFPGGLFIGGYGPPLDYATGNARALGGNPDIVPFLQGPVKPPTPQEAGWKDTAVMLPGMVTRLAVRWAPTDLAANTAPSSAAFAFDPNALGHGYVWHCHIIDHEDNEMMRPTSVTPLAVERSYNIGNDY